MRDLLSDLSEFSVDYKNREIYVGKYYNNSEDDDIESKTASMFIKNLRALDSNKDSPILIHFNLGGGGEWEAGMAMYDAISFTKSYTTILIYGYGMSMSSIIPQAADYRVMMPNSYLMLHYGHESFVDNHSNNRKYFSFATKFRNQMIDIYANRMMYAPFLKSNKRIKDKYKYCYNLLKKKMGEGDWYFTAEQALDYGLVDDILGSKTCLDFEVLKSA